MKLRAKESCFKQRAKIILDRLKEETDIYCQETTLHGLHYITSKKSSKIQSMIWLVLCLVGMTFCVYYINEQLMRYNTSRVSTNIATTAYSIYDVPFPSVTFCNLNLVYASNTEKIEKIIKDQIPKEEIQDFFQNLSTLILNDNLYDTGNPEAYENITSLLHSKGYDTGKIMKTLAQPCDLLLSECRWNYTVVACNSIFRSIKTTHGFCCSFNYKGSSDESEISNMDTIYATGVGSAFGLEVTLNVSEEEYVSTLKPYYGIQVAVHENYQYPDMSMSSTTIFPGFKNSYGLIPQIIYSNDELRDIYPERRGCLFYNERKMHWSSRYSFSSCINECRLKAILKWCHCVPYFYPIVPKNRTKYCTMLDSRCLKLTAGYFSKYDESKSEEYEITKSMKECKCLPQCNEIAYNYRLESHPSSKQILGYNENNETKTIVNVYFAVAGCIQFRRSIMLTWDSLLGSIGGILGLCMGGSIMSVIEFIYFLILILVKRYKKNKVVTFKEDEVKIFYNEFYPQKIIKKF